MGASFLTRLISTVDYDIGSSQLNKTDSSWLSERNNDSKKIYNHIIFLHCDESAIILRNITPFKP